MRGGKVVCQKEMGVIEALKGYSEVIEHISGKKIRVYTPKGLVVTPGMKFVAEGMGLPIEANFDGSYVYDDMLFIFKVNFPESLSTSEIKFVKEAFKERLDVSNED